MTLFAFAVIVASLFAIAWRFRRANRVTEPSCPNCFYNVSGLQSPICPECGADLSRVGVLQPGNVRPLGRMALMAYSTLFLLSIAWIASPFIFRAIPPLWALKAQVVLSQPASGSHVQVLIDGSHTFRTPEQGRAPILALYLIRKDGSNSKMEVDFNSLQCEFDDAKGERVTRMLELEGELLGIPLVEWFAASKVEQSPALRREVDQVATVLRNHYLMQNRTPQTGILRAEDVFSGAPGISGQMSSRSLNNTLPYRSVDMGSSVSLAKDPLALPLVIGGWFAVWLIVIAIVLWLTRRGRKTSVTAPTIPEAPILQGTFMKLFGCVIVLALCALLNGCGQQPSATANASAASKSKSVGVSHNVDPTVLRFHVTGMHCDGCAQGLKSKLAKIEGVIAADASFEDSSATVTSNDAIAATVLEAIKEMQYQGELVEG